MSRESPGEVAMRFQVRDLMSNVFPRAMAMDPCTNITDQTCVFDSTGGECGCPEPSCRGGQSCQGQSCLGPSCPHGSHRSPGIAREMLGLLHEQLRQALLPA